MMIGASTFADNQLAQRVTCHFTLRLRRSRCEAGLRPAVVFKYLSRGYALPHRRYDENVRPRKLTSSEIGVSFALLLGIDKVSVSVT